MNQLKPCLYVSSDGWKCLRPDGNCKQFLDAYFENEYSERIAREIACQGRA